MITEFEQLIINKKDIIRNFFETHMGGNGIIGIKELEKFFADVQTSIHKNEDGNEEIKVDFVFEWYHGKVTAINRSENDINFGYMADEYEKIEFFTYTTDVYVPDDEDGYYVSVDPSEAIVFDKISEDIINLF